ncbi:hypothetical protein Droror1_Dr00020975 [Drosera rotundifolia]
MAFLALLMAPLPNQKSIPLPLSSPWIASSLSEDVLLQVVHCTSARDIWTTLDTLNGTVSRSRVQSTKRKLHALVKGALSATAYIHQARALSRTPTLAGEFVSDTDLIFLILVGLPAVFDSAVAAIQLANPLPSLDTVTTTIIDFEQCLRGHTAATMSSIALAATIKSQENKPLSHGLSPASNRGSYRGARGRGSGTRGRAKSRAAPITGDSLSVYCYKCGYLNHKANVCEAPSSATPPAQAFTALQIFDQTDALWYPDTGASNHITSNPFLTEGTTSYTGFDRIIMGNGSGVPIISTGNVHLSPSLILEKVLVLPHIQKNLLRQITVLFFIHGVLLRRICRQGEFCSADLEMVLFIS